MADEVRVAFAGAYVIDDGRLTSDSQTAYALALEFDLLPDAYHRSLAGERLAELVQADGYRIGTGFLGTPLICDAVCHADECDSAYRWLLERGCPSWLYPVTMGATTIWERWDSMLSDGTINTGEMTSFNHYAFGAIADWLQRTVGGLAPLEPRYRRISIAPQPGAGMTSARARHETPYGRAEVAWFVDGAELHVEAVVPPNTSATVDLPGGVSTVTVGSGRHTWTVPADPAWSVSEVAD